MKDAPAGTESREIESAAVQQLPQLPVRRTLVTTLMFLLFLVLSATVFMGQARAQGLNLGGGGDQPSEQPKETLDLGPAPTSPAATQSSPSAAGGVGASPILLILFVPSMVTGMWPARNRAALA